MLTVGTKWCNPEYIREQNSTRWELDKIQARILRYVTYGLYQGQAVNPYKEEA